jgi:hypothetical protein
MKRRLALAATLFAITHGASLLPTVCQIQAAESVVFTQNFDKLPAGDLPADFLVLNGVFTVAEDAGAKFAELPGSPLEDFGFLFGPSEASGLEASARIFGSKQGRKFPTFALGVNGGGGYKIRVAPAKKAIELIKGEEIIKSTPLDWKSGEWTSLKLRVRKTAEGYKIEGKAWQGSSEPTEWALSLDEKEALPPGKSGVWGMPYAGTPIRFDDLQISKLAP